MNIMLWWDFIGCLTLPKLAFAISDVGRLACETCLCARCSMGCMQTNLYAGLGSAMDKTQYMAEGTAVE
jgi:hypothetical protein